MTHVVLIRPGATVYDDQNRAQGALDIPLSDRGKTEISHLAVRLTGLELAAIYCGPSESACRTAESIGRAVGTRPKRLDDLRNLDQGLWQGLQVDEIKRRHTRIFRQWLDDPLTVCPPEGETVADAIDRIRAVLKPILRRHRDEAIGLVVADPLARVISCFLRRVPRVEFEEEITTGTFETIDVSPDVLKNGDGG